MSKLVTFEQAKKLKELGYDKKCLLYHHDGFIYGLNPSGCSEYDIEIDDLYVNFNADDILNQYPNNWYGKIIDEIYSAPTIHKALDWFREVKGIVCWVQFEYNGGSMWYGTIIQKDEQMTPLHTDSFDIHSEAESALLDALIEYLS